MDLGYGAYPVTTVRGERLWTVRPDLRVLGLEIDPERVAAAGPYQKPPKLEFRLGGFELPVPAPPVLLRAFNVLRQYDEGAVAEVGRGSARAWHRTGCCSRARARRTAGSRCGPRWARKGPRTLSFAANLATLESPAIFAQRLPKVLIHRNVPGEACTPSCATGTGVGRVRPPRRVRARQRWIGSARMLGADWPVLDRESRWRLGELTVSWEAVAPRGR